MLPESRYHVNMKVQPHAKSKVKYRLRGPIVERLLHRYAS